MPVNTTSYSTLSEFCSGFSSGKTSNKKFLPLADIVYFEDSTYAYRCPGRDQGDSNSGNIRDKHSSYLGKDSSPK